MREIQIDSDWLKAKIYDLDARLLALEDYFKK